MEDVPEDWNKAIDGAADKRRILVLGATDMGKTSFIRALAASGPVSIIDLDPGQKLIGPPGTASLGRLGPPRLERFIFLGSTSASNIGAIARAGAALAGEAALEVPFVVNTSGFVLGLGARLQALTAAAVKPDLIIEIGGDPAAAPIASAEGAGHVRLERAPEARSKSAAERARIRQAAFERSLDGAVLLRLKDVEVQPKPLDLSMAPDPLARPVCALADRDGKDLSIGVIEGEEREELLVWARSPAQPVALVRLGKMWAAQGEGGWRLLEKLKPAWSE